MTASACLSLVLVACDQTGENISPDAGQNDSAESERQREMLGARDPDTKGGRKVRTIGMEGIEIPAPDAEMDLGGSAGFDISTQPGVVVESWDAWIDGFHRVDAVLYDWSADKDQTLVQSGKLHKGVVHKFTKTLTAGEVDRLEKLVTGSRRGEAGSFCYFPHHGFVFYDKSDKIMGHLELCLMCGNYYPYPKRGLSDNWDLDGMERLLKDKGMPTRFMPDEWEEFFKEQK